MLELILVFFAVSLVNVVLQTLRAVLTIKSSRLTAAIMSSVAYGFYTIVIKLVTGVDIFVATGLTVLANFIGVYISFWLLNKFKKDRLWKITVTTYSYNVASIVSQLEFYDIGYSVLDIISRDDLVEINIYSDTQKETTIVKDILSKLHGIKYHYMEVGRTL